MTRSPYRLGRRGARRLLDGDPAARAADPRLAALLDALASVEADGETDGGDREVPVDVLTAFARHAEAAGPRPGHGRRSGARVRARSRQTRSALTVKTAAVVLALSGGTMAAAAADALPAPAQRAAHHLFGHWGVPAPSAPPHGVPDLPRPSLSSVLPGGSPTSKTPSAPAAATAPGAGGSASVGGKGTASPGTSACATHTHGNGHHCDASGADDAKNGDNGKNGAGDRSATSTATPAPTGGTASHVPPGHEHTTDAAVRVSTR
jgi:hypothetical protein